MDMPVSGSVMILCSGFGLGFYIPGLLIGEKLRRMGIGTEVGGVRESAAANEDPNGGEESSGVSRELSGGARLSEDARRHPRQPGSRRRWSHCWRDGKGRIAGTSSAFPVIGCMSWICTER